MRSRAFRSARNATLCLYRPAATSVMLAPQHVAGVRLADTPEHAAVDGTVITMTPALLRGEPRLEALFAPFRECVELRWVAGDAHAGTQRAEAARRRPRRRARAPLQRRERASPPARSGTSRAPCKLTGCNLGNGRPLWTGFSAMCPPSTSRTAPALLTVRVNGNSYESNFHVNGEDGGGCN